MQLSHFFFLEVFLDSLAILKWNSSSVLLYSLHKNDQKVTLSRGGPDHLVQLSFLPLECWKRIFVNILEVLWTFTISQIIPAPEIILANGS